MNWDAEAILSEARRVLELECAVLQSGAEQLKNSQSARDFVAAVEIILECQGRVVVTGLGKSGAIGRKIASTLASTGTPAQFLHAAEALHGDLGMVARGDVLLAISNSGRSDEILSILTTVKLLDVPVVALTGNRQSPLGANADLVIEASVEREACPHNLAPTSSTTLTLALGDALAICVMQKRGFESHDFARFHPGGNLGRGLTLKVADLMRVEERMALCRQNDTIKAALESITKATAGAALVCDDQGILCGYLTDGDLRRQLLRAADAAAFMASPVHDSMTKNPLSLRAEMPAIEALRLLQERRVDDAPVVDEDGFPVGWLDEGELFTRRIDFRNSN